MADQAIARASEKIDIARVQRRVRAILIGLAGNLVAWYDFYAYTAFALCFAPVLLPQQHRA